MTFPTPLLSLAVLTHIHTLIERNPSNLVDFPPQADMANLSQVLHAL